MTFIRTIPPAEAEGEIREMYQRTQAELGYVPNYAKTFSARPRHSSPKNGQSISITACGDLRPVRRLLRGGSGGIGGRVGMGGEATLASTEAAS